MLAMIEVAPKNSRVAAMRKVTQVSCLSTYSGSQMGLFGWPAQAAACVAMETLIILAYYLEQN